MRECPAWGKKGKKVPQQLATDRATNAYCTVV